MNTTRFTSADKQVDALYEGLAVQNLQPLWELKGILTSHPQPKTIPFLWRMKDLVELGTRAMELVPIDRGGDRRVLALSNPGLGGAPFATNSLWAATQFLGPGEAAPAHRHSPAALRFVLDGGGVWTMIDGDPLHMGRGDLVLTPAWRYHEHHNPGQDPMVWLDILDLPMVQFLDGIFFEEGPSEMVDPRTDPVSGSELLYGRPGLLPVGAAVQELPAHSPLLAYRWSDTEAALEAIIAAGGLTDATVRFKDPTRDADVMPTMRCEMRRILGGTTTTMSRQTGSRVCAVLNGSGTVRVGSEVFELREGDIYVVPSWNSHQLTSYDTLDIFITSDAPVMEALHIYREETD